ncbi:MAG: protocatechuate 3,4-dioxygenase subunit alpha [Pseudomonadota bacterium]
MARLKETPSQTAGPYVHIGLAPKAAGFDIFEHEPAWDIAGAEAQGERIRVEGIVLDGTGEPVKDVLIEIWQANAAGHYAGGYGSGGDGAGGEGAGPVEPGFRGWGRTISDFDSGEWGFDTVKPGAVTAPDGTRHAPHLNLWIVARGVNMGLNTRAYFDDEEEANAADPVLSLPELAPRADTLIARREMRGNLAVYRFEIRLQGDGETIFFDI